MDPEGQRQVGPRRGQVLQELAQLGLLEQLVLLQPAGLVLQPVPGPQRRQGEPVQLVVQPARLVEQPARLVAQLVQPVRRVRPVQLVPLVSLVPLVQLVRMVARQRQHLPLIFWRNQNILDVARLALEPETGTPASRSPWC